MAKYKLTDETLLAKVKELHRLFMTYLPKYADVRKEKYFVTQQVSSWEQYRKNLLTQIAQKQRRVNIVVPEKRAMEQQGLQQLQTTLAIADDELDRLYTFVNTLPEWMWKEIVQLTDLRVKEVNDPNWEKLTPDKQEQKDEAQYAEFREIMNKWKQDNLTGWREEHERTDQLIVTRSVCNEVAEQIQHLRGFDPPGGLTPRAPWYLKNERDGTVPGTPRPYFTKPTSAKDYSVGISILWLRFVNELPNPWRVAHPLQTKTGDGLIPAQYLARTSADDWTYTQNDVVTRTRLRTNAQKQTIKEQQWLRWIHEATVAEVAETMDGTTILTFETALPYDDPRLSAVGVFKHSIDNLLFDGGEETYNGSFVGFLPEYQAKVPGSNLTEMLDWNRILRRQVMNPTELADYQKKYILRT